MQKYLLHFLLFMDKIIDFNSGDWKQRNSLIYYSRQKHSWYCTECKLLIVDAPKTAGIHAKEHNLTLPCSRKKSKVKIVKPIPYKISIQNIAEKEVEPTSSQLSNFQSYSTPTNIRRIYNNPPPSGRADPEELKRWRRQQGEDKISFMRKLGCTEKEIEDAKVEFGLITKKELLAKKEEDRRQKQIDDLYLMKVASVPDPEQQVNLLMEYYILRQM